MILFVSRKRLKHMKKQENFEYIWGGCVTVKLSFVKKAGKKCVLDMWRRL